MLRFSALRLVVSSFALIVFAGCGDSGPDLGPPAGWQTDGDRWWQEGVDTTVAFRDLETFEAMDLSERPDGRRMEGPAHRNVQRKLMPLYRNAPEAVDSIFTAVAVPLIDERMEEDDRAALERDVTRAINEQFFYPRPKSEPEVRVVYPDSLRQAGIGGDVKVQVYLSDEGEPLAVKLVESVNPTLDRIALSTRAQMRWIPAAVAGEPVPSYVRSVLGFTVPQ